MTWWAAHSSDGEVMKHVADSKQWEFIDNTFREMLGHEDRNIRMGLVTDGFCPHSEKRSTYSLWPILLMNYNLPPWLTTKRYFIMLSILIPGPESVTSDSFDVFLQPLLEELLELWTVGVYCMDAARYRDESHFVLKAMVIWTVGDFPAYGTMAGCVTKGFVGCPVCGEGFRSRRSKALHKNEYCDCARRWLSVNHPLRSDSVNFTNPEHRPPPQLVTGEQFLQWGREREQWLRDYGAPSRNDPVRKYGIKRVSALYQLPYWKVHRPITVLPHLTPHVLTKSFASLRL